MRIPETRLRLDESEGAKRTKAEKPKMQNRPNRIDGAFSKLAILE